MRQLFATSRPVTGVFAALLTLIGFRYFHPVPLVLTLLTALAFAGITWCIMSFNDYVDRHHDIKKGKTFASEHTRALLHYCWLLGGATTVLLLVISVIDSWVALFSALVWVAGIGYSFVPHWYIGQNLIVALSCGSPVLVGAIHERSLKTEPFLIFGAFVFIFLTREIYKDMEDQSIDAGYKATMPVVIGHSLSTLRILGLTYGWALCLVLYPNPWARALAATAAATQFAHGLLLLRPDRATRAKQVMDWVIPLVLVFALVTQ